MEDNSYVSLSLEKYNELYDKAKKFDKLQEQYESDIEKCIDKTIEHINKLLDSSQEQVATTEIPVEEELKVGDTVQVMGKIIAIDNSNLPYKIEITNGCKEWFKKEDVKKINEREEK